jgi:hypothetical protein
MRYRLNDLKFLECQLDTLLTLAKVASYKEATDKEKVNLESYLDELNYFLEETV